MSQRYGPFEIRPEGLKGQRAHEYEATLLGIIRAIDSISAGRAVLNGFRFNQEDCLIVPYDGSAGTKNALGGAPKGAFNFFDSQVWFSPRDFFPVYSGCCNPNAGGMPDEALTHELVHAVRWIEVRMRYNTAFEEWVAILVTNIYSSNTNRPLRQNHEGWADIRDPELKSTEGYFLRNRQLIEAFCTQQPNFSRFLSHVKCPWNPVREYYERKQLNSPWIDKQ